MIFKRYVDNNFGSPWKVILDYFLSGVGGKFILHVQCNFDIRKLPICLPVFYKESLNFWAALNEVSVLSYETVVNHIIWNMTKGIATIGDLLSDTGPSWSKPD